MEKLNKKKKLWILFSALIGIIVIVTITLLAFYLSVSYPEFFATAHIEIAIPALDDGFIPQGLAVTDEDGYLVAGYMKDKTKKSRLYISDKLGNNVKYVTLGKGAEGLEYEHFGGVAAVGNNIWISTFGQVIRLNKQTVMNSHNADAVVVIDKFNCPNRASFCYANSENLYVGEFYGSPFIKTDKSHKIKTSFGTNNAIICQYKINSDKQYGISSTVPTAVISIPNKAQGFAISENGKVVLSTSFGIADSKILIYDIDLSKPSRQIFKIENENAPLYILDKTNLKEKIIAPAMAEGIDYAYGRLYILFESATKKYKNVNRTRTKNIISIEVA